MSGNLLEQHLHECAECDPEAVRRLDKILAADVLEIDAERLSAQSMPLLAAALDGNSAETLWRRVVTAMVFAVAPLPLVLAWDTYVLSALHELLQSLMPTPIATYVTFSYAAVLVLLMAATYAAIPLMLGRRSRAWGPDGLGA